MGFMLFLFFYLPCGALVLGVAFHLLTKKFLNPFKLTMVVGKKGSGKTTLMVRTAYEYLAKGWTVFCTERLDGCVHIDYKDIGYKQIPPWSLLLIDEVGMIWDSRNFSKFPEPVRDWFKLQRHYKVKVMMFSQSFDVDKKLRDLTDEMFLVTNQFRVFSWAKRIIRKIVLVKPAPDAPAHIDEELAYDSLLAWPFGSRILTYIPKWAPYFDSHNCPELEEKDWEVEPELKIPKSLQKVRKRQTRNTLSFMEKVRLFLSKYKKKRHSGRYCKQ